MHVNKSKQLTRMIMGTSFIFPKHEFFKHAFYYCFKKEIISIYLHVDHCESPRIFHKLFFITGITDSSSVLLIWKVVQKHVCSLTDQGYLFGFGNVDASYYRILSRKKPDVFLSAPHCHSCISFPFLAFYSVQMHPLPSSVCSVIRSP